MSLLSLNTNLWYKSNRHVQDLVDPAGQFTWLQRVLEECQTNNRTVIIFGHIPPGKFERFYQFCGEYKGCDTHGGYQGFHWMRSDFQNHDQFKLILICFKISSLRI